MGPTLTKLHWWCGRFDFDLFAVPFAADYHWWGTLGRFQMHDGKSKRSARSSKVFTRLSFVAEGAAAVAEHFAMAHGHNNRPDGLHLQSWLLSLQNKIDQALLYGGWMAALASIRASCLCKGRRGGPEFTCLILPRPDCGPAAVSRFRLLSRISY